MVSRLDLPPGRYQIRIGAHESTGATVATVPLDVEVPDYAKTNFVMSGVAIGSSNDSGIAVTANLDQLSRDTFGVPPVVRRTFTREETLATYAEVYDNSSPMAHALTYVVSVRGAADGRSVFEARDRRDVEAGRSTRTHGFRTPVPLTDLQPGLYVLHVEATAGSQTATRDIPFEVR
jgi:hypothetical protein